MKKSLIIWYAFLLLLLILTSCDIQKQATKSKSDTELKENIETITKRVGDTVRYEVPKITYRDTIIYTTNRQGTTLKTVYDNSGSISSIDCFASAIEEIKRENREFKESLKDKEKVKTEDFDSSFILYIVIGIVILGMFALFLAFLYLKNRFVLK